MHPLFLGTVTSITKAKGKVQVREHDAGEQTMEPTRETTILIATGSPVYAADGERVGKVKTVQGLYFEVDVSGSPDYWLPATAIASTQHTNLYLRFGADVVSRMAVPPPTEQ